jgi:hypothetical protein
MFLVNNSYVFILIQELVDFRADAAYHFKKEEVIISIVGRTSNFVVYQERGDKDGYSRT